MSRFKLDFYLWPAGFLILGGTAGFILSQDTSPARMKTENTALSTSITELPQHSQEWTSRKINLTSPPEKSTKQQLDALLDPLLKGQIPHDWHAELQKLFDILQTKKFKTDALRLFFTKWAEDDFNTAMEEAGKLGLWAFSVKKEIFDQSVKTVPEKVASYFEKNREQLSHYRDLVRNITENWARKSSEEAWEWSTKLSKNDQPAAFHGILRSLDLNNKEQIVNYINKLDKEKSLSTNALIYWAREKPDDALDWFSTSGQEKRTYKEAIIRGIADKNLTKASELIATLPSSDKSVVVSRISIKINAEKGPEEALEWIQKQHPASEISSLELLSPLSSWVASSPNDAKAWIQKQPDSKMRDKSISLYSENVPGASYYDGALELINSTGNESTKKEILESTLKKWERLNPDAFKKWQQEPSRSEQVRKIINQSNPE